LPHLVCAMAMIYIGLGHTAVADSASTVLLPEHPYEHARLTTFHLPKRLPFNEMKSAIDQLLAVDGVDDTMHTVALDVYVCSIATSYSG